MIDFVLDHSGEHAVGIEFMFFTVEILRLDRDLNRAFHNSEDSGDRQAAFLQLHFFPGFCDNFWVDQGKGRQAEVFEVDNAKSDGFADLRGGQADAVDHAGGFDHFIGEFNQLVIDLFNESGFLI